MTDKRVIVIGAGITGLTVAYYLQKQAKEKHLPLNVRLFEGSDRVGGKMQTVKRDGFTIERGPDSFLVRKESASRLAKEAGIDDHLVRNSSGQSYVLAREKLYKMPEGSFMGIPTQVGPFIKTPLFTPAGKLRAGLDLILPSTNHEEDVAVGKFFRHRLGDEVVENLIEPLLSGIYAGDIDELSLRSTFPQFEAISKKHRSLILGMKHLVPKQEKKQETGKKQGIFYTIDTGLESFAKAISEHLEDGSLCFNHSVATIEKNSDGTYDVLLKNGEHHHADYVVVTVPHHQAGKMLEHYSFANELKQAKLASVATVAMAFDEDALEKDSNGTGFVVSRNADYTITACTWTHRKWPHTTPKGKVLLRCYVGRSSDDSIVHESDDTIVETSLRDLNKIMSIKKKPDFSIVSRWEQSMPQYTVGHKERVHALMDKLNQELPNLFLTGSSYLGVGIPDCIEQGENVVKTIIQQIEK